MENGSNAPKMGRKRLILEQFADLMQVTSLGKASVRGEAPEGLSFGGTRLGEIIPPKIWDLGGTAWVRTL
jgi:hypothetical protein